jgi:hypothetical protein
MPFQFNRLGKYGVAPRKGAAAWSNIAGVTAEAARVPSASNHVKERFEPLILFGVGPLAAGTLALQRATSARDAIGRKLRKDGCALLAGVVSYPAERKALDAIDRDAYGLWCQDVLAFLKRHFGDHLISVVEHTDDRFLHLHYFVVPTLDARNRLNVNQLHPGCRAKAAAEAAGAGKKAGDTAYRAAMREWLDDFHREVSAFHRHDRYGPKRAHLSRRRWQMEKEIEAERSRTLEDAGRHAAEVEAAARRRAREYYAAPYRASEQRNQALAAALAAETAQRLKGQVALRAERQAADARHRADQAEIEMLRVQLAALQPPAEDQQRYAA